MGYSCRTSRVEYLPRQGVPTMDTPHLKKPPGGFQRTPPFSCSGGVLLLVNDTGIAPCVTRAGRPVHFTTVARWKKREWQVEVNLERPLAAAMRKIDLLFGCPK